MIYVTVALAVLMGMAALAIDVGRLDTTSTHAKQAADAAAIAAASQLDGTLDAITRATNAAEYTLLSTPLVGSSLVRNRQTLGATPGNISIAKIRYLNGLPAGTPTVPNDPSELDPYVTTDPLEARFAEVTTAQVVQNNWFIRALGSGPTTSTAGVSVAGFTQTICRRAPLVICNPAEETVTGAPFDSAYWKGKQILVKASGPTSAWTPGDFGLADVEGVQSAPEIANALAESEPDVCVSALIDVKPGQTQSTRTGLNTRFDMYENPFFGGASDRTNPKIRPAKNVRKGMIRNPADAAGQCTYIDDPAGQAKGLPRDSNIIAGTSRFGNGIWDCPTYWSTNHPGVAVPAQCTNGTWSRYQLYRHEIDAGLLDGADNTSAAGENGLPQCGYGAPNPNEAPDRREVVFAVINCIEHGPINGNSAGPIPVEAFVKALLTEPVGDGPDFDTYLEVIDITRPGADDGILHDMVQLYR